MSTKQHLSVKTKKKKKKQQQQQQQGVLNKPYIR